MQIVARKRISGLIEPLMVGSTPIGIAGSLLWIAQPIQWYAIAAAALLLLNGTFWIVYAVKGWWPRGIGLVFTSDGISWHALMRLTLRSWVISWRWDDVLRAHYVTRKEIRFAGAGAVIVELRPEARSWPNAKWAKKGSERLQKQLGRKFADNLLMLIDQQWNWQPQDVTDWINEAVDDAESRARWDTDRLAPTAEPT